MAWIASLRADGWISSMYRNTKPRRLLAGTHPGHDSAGRDAPRTRNAALAGKPSAPGRTRSATRGSKWPVCRAFPHGCVDRSLSRPAETSVALGWGHRLGHRRAGLAGGGRRPAYDPVMADKPQRAGWTQDEIKREQAAERARVRRDAARGVSKNLENAVAHTEFAKRFAEAFEHARRR